MGIDPRLEIVTEAIPFADLYLHPLNPRQTVTEAEIAALASNIRELGLIQNLAGLRDETGKVGIVAGGRRLRALALLQDDPRFLAIPVKMAADEETAAVWAAAENHARADLHPADEIRNYAQLSARGVAVAAIAIAFGTTKAHVKRRLRLADLPEPVMQALRNDKIGLSDAACFVVCDDLGRVEEVLAQVIRNPNTHSEESIRRMLKAGAVRDTDRRARFVGVPAYRAAGGRISSDLFGGEVYLDDPAILDACLDERLAVLAAEIRARDGWKWVTTSLERNAWQLEMESGAEPIYPRAGELTEEQAARYDELAALSESEDGLTPEDLAELEALDAIMAPEYAPIQRQHAGLIVYVDYQGALCLSRAMVLPDDKLAAAAAGIIDAPEISETDDTETAAEEAQKPKLSDILTVDLRTVLTGARQHAALQQPDLLLDLLAYHLQSPFGSAFSVHRNNVNIQPSTETGYAPDPRLLDVGRIKSPDDEGRAFRAFQKRGPEHVRDTLTLALARLLDVDAGRKSALAAAFDKLAKVNVRDVWTPTAENFFKRAPSPYLDALWCELHGIEPDSAEARTYGKAKKAEKAARLETMFNPETKLPADQRARVAKWLPPEMTS